MKRILTTLPALLLAGAALAFADDKAPQKPKSPTSAELKKMVEDLGFKTAKVSETVFEFTYVREDYDVPIRMGTGRDRIGVVCQVTYVPRPAEVPASAFRKLLEANDQRSPDRWIYEELDRYVTFARTFDAPGLTPVALKKQLDSFHTTVKAQKGLWENKVFKPDVKPIKDDEYAKKERSALEGKFEAVEGTYNGIASKDLDKDDTRFQLDFARGRWLWNKQDAPLEARFEPGEDGGPARVSMYRGDGKILYRAIYKRQGKKLTLCMDWTGQFFPAEFDGSKGKNQWLLELETK